MSHTNTNPGLLQFRAPFHTLGDDKRYIIAKIIYFICIDIWCIYLSFAGNMIYMSCLLWFCMGGVIHGLGMDLALRRILIEPRETMLWGLALNVLWLSIIAAPVGLIGSLASNVPAEQFTVYFRSSMALLLASGLMGQLLSETMANARFFTGVPQRLYGYR